MSADKKNNVITAAFWIGLLVHLMGLEFNDPMNWKNKDFTTLFLLITNIFFLRLYYNKIRKR